MSRLGVVPAVEAGGPAVIPHPPVLGLDIGGTKLAAGLVDGAGRVLSFLVEPTLAEEGATHGLERLFTLGRRAIVESGLDPKEIRSVGIGCGGLSIRSEASSSPHRIFRAGATFPLRLSLRLRSGCRLRLRTTQRPGPPASTSTAPGEELATWST